MAEKFTGKLLPEIKITVAYTTVAQTGQTKCTYRKHSKKTEYTHRNQNTYRKQNILTETKTLTENRIHSQKTEYSTLIENTIHFQNTKKPKQNTLSGEDKGRARRAQHDQFFYLKLFFSMPIMDEKCLQYFVRNILMKLSIF